MANNNAPSVSAASTTARAVDIFVAAVEARGGTTEVATRGSVKIVTVTVGGQSRAVRIKGTSKDEWQARKTESIAGKSGAEAWALIDLADGAPVALVAADEYAAFVSKLIGVWEAKNPEKTVTANTQFAITGDDVAPWEDAWALVGLGTDDGAAPAEKPAAKKAPAKAASKAAPAKKAAAAKAPAKKTPAKAKPVAAKAEAKITPIAEQKDAAAKAKPPVTIGTDDAAAKTAPKPAAPKPTAATKAEAKKPEAPKPDVKKTEAKKTETVEKAAPADKVPAEKAPAKKPESQQPTGIALLLKRLPVVGRLI